MPEGVGSYLARSAGSGRALAAPVRARLESSFGRSFGDVRVIADDQSARAADTLRARAFTVGRSIWFGRGEYQPGTRDGERLIAHELAHTVQAGSEVRAAQASLTVGSAGDPFEAEADRAADAALRGEAVHLSAAPAAPPIRRQPKPAADPDRDGLAAEKEIAQAIQSARAFKQQADAIVTGASEVDLDLVDIVMAQGEAVEETLTWITESRRSIARLAEAERRVVLGAASIELQLYIRNAEHLSVLNKNISLEIPDNVSNATEVEAELERYATWHEEWVVQNSYVGELAGDLVALGTGAAEKIEVNLLAAEKFTEYQSNLVQEGETLQILDTEMNSFASQASSMRTRQKIAGVLEIVLALRGGKGRLRSPKGVPRGGGGGFKPRAKFRRAKGAKKPNNPKKRKKRNRGGCTPAEITAMNTELHKYCNQRRRCSMQADDCSSATAKVAAGMGCVRGRTELQQKCFKKSDAGYANHMSQLAEASAALHECETIMMAKCT